jgi:MFS family permease
MFFKKRELELLWPFYLAPLINSVFSLISAYFFIYFLEIGYSIFQVTLIFVVMIVTRILFDIPTGAIADIYGRKFSVVISYFLTFILFLSIPLVNNLIGLLIIFFFMGISETLSTGAHEAWIISNLKSKKKENLIDEYYIKSSSIYNFGLVISPLIAAFVIKAIGISYIWTIQGVATLFAGFVLFLTVEKFKPKKLHIKDSFKETFKQSKKALTYAKNHNIIFKILIASIFLLFVISGVGIFWQPYLREFNLPLEYYGYLLSFSGLLSIAIPFMAKKISDKFNRKSSYLIVVNIIHLIILVSVFFVTNSWVAMVFVTLLYLAYQFIMPIEQPFFQSFLPNKMRATLGSVKSIFGSLGAALALLFLGWFADFAGVKMALSSLGIFLIPVLWIYWRIRKKEDYSNKTSA